MGRKKDGAAGEVLAIYSGLMFGAAERAVDQLIRLTLRHTSSNMLCLISCDPLFPTPKLYLQSTTITFS